MSTVLASAHPLPTLQLPEDESAHVLSPLHLRQQATHADMVRLQCPAARAAAAPQQQQRLQQPHRAPAAAAAATAAAAAAWQGPWGIADLTISIE
jgi:hypothetical protein